MKMDGYDVIREDTGIENDSGVCLRTIYRVYTLPKHYRYGYTSYKQMVAAHPELKDNK